MTWPAALTTGFGLGLAYFGGLWLSVRQLTGRRHPRAWLAIGRALRLALAALVFCALSRHGAEALLVGLLGFWLARWLLLVRVAGVHHP